MVAKMTYVISEPVEIMVESSVILERRRWHHYPGHHLKPTHHPTSVAWLRVDGSAKNCTNSFVGKRILDLDLAREDLAHVHVRTLLSSTKQEIKRITA